MLKFCSPPLRNKLFTLDVTKSSDGSQCAQKYQHKDTTEANVRDQPSSSVPDLGPTPDSSPVMDGRAPEQTEQTEL